MKSQEIGVVMLGGDRGKFWDRVKEYSKRSSYMEVYDSDVYWINPLDFDFITHSRITWINEKGDEDGKDFEVISINQFLDRFPSSKKDIVIDGKTVKVTLSEYNKIKDILAIA